ncbi:DUF5999 family protein, partial [Streptomyces katsurahamanus]|uniref:DUF5999 family protein n=1 Tax=Streptomyces katsurahamanus TaxID=2577098 RepID=UPI00188689D3
QEPRARAVGARAVVSVGGCTHRPLCPAPDAEDRSAAVSVSRDCLAGWALLCNGVIHFDDGGEVLPNGKIIAPLAQAAA